MSKRNLGSKDESRARMIVRLSGMTDAIKILLDQMVVDENHSKDAPIWAVKQVAERAQELAFDARVYMENLKHKATPVAITTGASATISKSTLTRRSR